MLGARLARNLACPCRGWVMTGEQMNHEAYQWTGVDGSQDQRVEGGSRCLLGARLAWILTCPCRGWVMTGELLNHEASQWTGVDGSQDQRGMVS